MTASSCNLLGFSRCLYCSQFDDTNGLFRTPISTAAIATSRILMPPSGYGSATHYLRNSRISSCMDSLLTLPPIPRRRGLTRIPPPPSTETTNFAEAVSVRKWRGGVACSACLTACNDCRIASARTSDVDACGDSSLSVGGASSSVICTIESLDTSAPALMTNYDISPSTLCCSTLFSLIVAVDKGGRSFKIVALRTRTRVS